MRLRWTLEHGRGRKKGQGGREGKRAGLHQKKPDNLPGQPESKEVLGDRKKIATFRIGGKGLGLT